ncbi:MAG: RNA polymerase subunit sigma-70 [Myxococcota bacterium]
MDAQAFERQVAPHRAALRGYCYRLLGALADAEDAVQDTLVRAWKAIDSFEGRSSLKTWLFQIASRVCFDALASRPRRALSLGEGTPFRPEDPITVDEQLQHLEPAPDAWLEPDVGPEARIERKQSIGLAFLVALQDLPAQQRAVLVLREVLGLSAAEAAEVLDTTVAGVNSALQRARASLDEKPQALRVVTEGTEQELLSRYLRAWEASDVQQLVATLKDDVTLTMPPMAQWYRGARDVMRVLSQPFILAPKDDAARFKALPTRAAGLPAAAVYRRAGPGQPYLPDSIHVLQVSGDRVGLVVAWLVPTLPARFGLPAVL